MPTYVAGDTIRVCVEVRSWPAQKGICRIYATFVHEADPTKEIEISDDPESRSHAQVQTEDDVELRGLVITSDHPVGEYRLKEMAAEYPGGARYVSPGRRRWRSGWSRTR
jgi:hypothetical protein